MDRAEVISQLRALESMKDAEVAHGLADEILLRLIDDPEITATFQEVTRWYA